MLGDLAALYSNQGKYAQAEPLLESSLAINEKTFGSDDLIVAQSLEDLAALLKKTNREAEAAKLEARAKAIRDKAR